MAPEFVPLCGCPARLKARTHRPGHFSLSSRTKTPSSKFSRNMYLRSALVGLCLATGAQAFSGPALPTLSRTAPATTSINMMFGTGEKRIRNLGYSPTPVPPPPVSFVPACAALHTPWPAMRSHRAIPCSCPRTGTWYSPVAANAARVVMVSW
jgi:hypothetical protein